MQNIGKTTKLLSIRQIIQDFYFKIFLTKIDYCKTILKYKRLNCQVAQVFWNACLDKFLLNGT